MKFATYLCSILIVMLASIASAQHTPFDFLEASRIANEVDRSIAKVNGLYGLGQKKCETATGVNGESVATCSVLPADYETPIIKADYAVDEIPLLVKENLPKQFVEDTKNKRVSCVYRFSVMNDNQPSFAKKDVKNPIKNNIYGDDFGRTHGLDVGVSCKSADGISNAFIYSTELFSNPDRLSARPLGNGNTSMNQTFVSENIFSLLQDNMHQNKLTYWKRGFGFINTSEKDKWGILQSTGQQRWVHNILDQLTPGTAYQYNNINGQKDDWGAFVTLAIGLQENRKFGDRCTLKINADVGVRVSTLKDTSIISANIEAKLAYQVTHNASVYLRAQSLTTLRSTSLIVENTVATGMETKSGSYIEMGATSQVGNRKDVHDSRNFYTGKNDLQVFLKVGKHF